MATIKQRDNGKWQAKIRKRGAQESRVFDSYDDAVAWAAITESEIVRGVFIPREEAERTTLKSALERYLAEVTVGKKGADQETYRINGTWLKDKLARKSLAALSGADFAAWRDTRLKAGYAPASVRNDLAIISHLFSVAAKEWGLPVTNPVKNMRLPSVNNARSRRLLPGEEEGLLEVFDGKVVGERSNKHVKAVVLFALETALRQEEIMSLQWRDVDMKKRVATVRGGADEKGTKNGDRTRDVPLSSRAVEVLQSLARPIKGGLVFPTTLSAIKQSWQRGVARARRLYVERCEEAGVEPDDRLFVDLHFHDLRHEATSRLAERLALHELMKVTGHRDTRMLSRYYHPRAEDLAKKLVDGSHTYASFQDSQPG